MFMAAIQMLISGEAYEKIKVREARWIFYWGKTVIVWLGFKRGFDFRTRRYGNQKEKRY